MKKRGGGARVKRLLTYDRGINPSDNAPVLYGQEYRYETVEGGRVISSGVAANEPGTGRMENPLVEPIDKSEQSKWEAILYGRDMYGQTGPIGEYIMPGPSVTYSVVTVSSIYKGKTSTGSEVHEFYTSRNYPFKFASTTIAQEFDNPIGLSGGAYGRGVSYSRQAPFLAQGYTFYQNEMDGQPKRNAKYSAAGTGTAPIAEEIYEYYQPGELLKLMNENLAIELGGPGVEREVLGEMVQVKDITNGGSIEPDLSLGTAVLPIAPIPVLIPTIKKLGIYRNEKILRTHVTNKIISYPAILKRTINRADGVVQRSDFEVFDKNTGAPLVTRTFDDQRGAYLSQELRAYWNYWNLGNKSRNEGLVTGGEINYGVDQGRPYIQFKGSGNCGVSGKFTEGDLIQLSPNNCSPSSELLYHVDAIDAGKDRLYLFSSGMKASNCTPPSSITSVKILRSGFKNQLNANMGQLMTHRADGAPTFFSSNPTNQAPPSHPLIDELNSALDLAIRQGGNQSGNILLAGPFAGISIPTDPCIIPGDCGNGGLMLTNANLHYRIDNGNLFLMLESAKVSNAQGQQVHVISCIPRTDTISVFNSNGPWNPGPIDIHNNYNVRTIAPNALSPNPLGTPSGLNPSNGFPMVSSYFPLPNSNQVVNSGGGQSGGNARTMGSGNGCNFPNPKIQDHLNRGNTNKEFHLDYEGDATEIVEYCQGALNPYVSWKMKDLKNVKNVIVVRKIDNSGNRTLIRGRWYSDKNPGTYQEFMPIIVDDGYFPGPGLYEFEIIMFKGKVEFDGNWNYEIKKTGALRSLVVYKCVNACAPSINKILMNGNGYSFPHASTGENIASDDVSIFETKCLGNVPSIQLAAQLVGFSPYQYVWTVNGPNTNITSPNASIQFSPTTPGIYQIGLRITDRFGKSDEVASNLRIVNCNACVASIDGPADYCLNYSPNGITNLPTPKTFTRNNQSNCSDNNCSWEVWKGTSRLVSSQPASCTSSPNSFTYTFTAPGEYFIHVRSENLNNPLGQPRATNDNVKKIEIVDCRPARADFTIEMGPCPDRKVIVKANPLSDVPISSYEWDFGDGTLASGMYASHSYSGCGTRTITLRYQKQSRVRMMPSSISHTFAGNAARPCHEICNCESSFSLPNWDNFASGTFTTTVGKFKYDPLTHGIDFVSPDCPRTYPLDCWRVCNPVTAGVAKDTISNVISASATTFSGNWGYDLARYPKTPSPANGPLYQGNPFEDGTRGRWLPMEQYVYRAPITQRDPNPGNYGLKSFNAGTFVLEMFDWRNGLNNSDKWVKTNTTRQYTPNSEPEEDENILKIRSTAKYGYRNTLLTLAAQNAAKNTVAFEGFENLYGSTTPYWEDGIPFLTGSGTVDPTNAFTGKKAMRLKENHLFEAAWIVGQGEPVVVRLWAKRLSRGGLNAGDLQVLVANGSPTNLKEITEAGEWTMYEGIIPALPTGNSVSLQLRTTISDLLVDDLRVQPYTSEMVCYVYDDAQRLLAAFDDQHFPLLYQYNAQGQLVRKLKVTREGTKVISETQYNTKGENRY